MIYGPNNEPLTPLSEYVKRSMDETLRVLEAKLTPTGFGHRCLYDADGKPIYSTNLRIGQTITVKRPAKFNA